MQKDYENPSRRRKQPKISMEEIVFTKEDVEDVIKRFASRKARDIERLQVEYLNWGKE